MKKLLLLSLIGAVTLFASCSDDNDDPQPLQNRMQIGEQTSKIAIFGLYTDVDVSSSSYVFVFASEGLYVENEEMLGKGNIMEIEAALLPKTGDFSNRVFEIPASSGADLVDGQFAAYGVTGVEPAAEEENQIEYEATSGTLTVSRAGDVWTIVMSCKTAKNEPVNLTYKGKITHDDIGS